MTGSRAPLALFQPPYRQLLPTAPDPGELRRLGRSPGSALVWRMAGASGEARLAATVRGRPGGLALILVLPPPGAFDETARLLRVVEEVRPASILPHEEEPTVEELGRILRRPPDDLPMEVTEYLRWRGLPLDRDTAHLVRRTVELSAELRSVAALSRAVYLSRRALGRRFMTRGLPVPSHWLHFARLLRVVLHLQNSDDSVLGAGYRLGYPDGFSLSNQMLRLTGYRPSEARTCLGWEWFMEAWLRAEANEGGLAPRPPVEPVHEPARRPRPTRMRQVG